MTNKTQCLEIEGNAWINRKYNFDDLGKALMSLFVLSSRDGWVNIMYTGLDSVAIDMQVKVFMLSSYFSIFYNVIMHNNIEYFFKETHDFLTKHNRCFF